MRIIKRQTLLSFMARHPETEQPLKAWIESIKKAEWRHSADVKASFPKASIINSERVVFDIFGGNYRMVVAINYSHQVIYVKFIGTHGDYDKINAATVSHY
jgi:mRNA interferase HigB